jgi:uncharacterized protein YeaO (DUF488 family)
MILIKRIYDGYSVDDGFRILVERLWPRGISKDESHIDLWMKDIAPSTELRKWFNHEDEKWEEFVKRYTIELSGNEEVRKLRELVKEHANVTFVYSARNVKHNSAVALKSIVESTDSHIS